MGAVALPVLRRKELVYIVVSLGLFAGTMTYVLQKVDGAFIGAVSRFTFTHLTLVVAACVLSTLVAALRLRSLAHEFGHPLRIGICLRTVAVSQAAAISSSSFTASWHLEASSFEIRASRSQRPF